MKPTILTINGSLSGGGANQIARLLHQSFRGQYNMRALVADEGINDPNVTSLFPDHMSKSLSRYKKIAAYAGLSGAQYLSGKYFMGQSLSHLLNQPSYQQADIVHFHNLHGAYFNLDLLPYISAHKKVVWTLQDDWAFTGHCAKTLRCKKYITHECRKCPFLKRYNRILLDTSHLFYQRKKKIYSKSNLTLVAPSHWMKKKILTGMLSGKKVHVVENGADPSIFKPKAKSKLRQKLKLPQDKFIISFIANHGQNNPWKGGFYVQEMIKRRLNPDFFYLSIGNPQAEKQKNHWKLPFIKDRSLLAEYYAVSDVLIHPSLGDTGPLTVFESLACGTPVVAFNTEGITEMIDHLKDGYLANYENIDDLIKGVLTFYKNPQLQKQAGKLGRKKIIKKYTLNHITEKYSKIYDSLLSNKKQKTKKPHAPIS